MGDIAYDMTDGEGKVGLKYLKGTQNIFSKIPYLTSIGNHENDIEYYK